MFFVWMVVVVGDAVGVVVRMVEGDSVVDVCVVEVSVVGNVGGYAVVILGACGGPVWWVSSAEVVP